MPLPVLEPRIVQLVVWSLYRLSCPGSQYPDGTFKSLPNHTYRSFSFDTTQTPCLKQSRWIAFRYSLYTSYLYSLNDVCSSAEWRGQWTRNCKRTWENCGGRILCSLPELDLVSSEKPRKKHSQDNYSLGLDLNPRLNNGCWRQMTSGHCYHLTD